MSSPLSYSRLADSLRQASLPYDPAELQGLLCGLLALSPSTSEASTLARLANHVGEERWPPALVAEWKQVRAQLLEAYQGEEMALELLLPDASLTARAEALCHWCEGFLAGFAELAGKSKLPANVNEALADLVAISQMEALAQEGEEERKLLMQVEEHCRLLALTIFTDMALVAASRRGLH